MPIASGAATASFAFLVSREVSFVSRASGDNVVIVLVGEGALELRVNAVFQKRVSVLRVHCASASLFDQDGWLIAVPRHLYSRVEQKLRVLADRVGIPIFDIAGNLDSRAPYPLDVVSRDVTSATLDMAGGTGKLRVSWARPSGSLEESTEVWSAHCCLSEASGVFAPQVLSACPRASGRLRAVAKWVAARAHLVFAVVDTTSVEGQVTASEIWPGLSTTSRAAILLVPSVPSAGSHITQGGAAAGYCAALSIHSLSFSYSSSPSPWAVVDVGLWPAAAEALLPMLHDQLPDYQAFSPLHFPAEVLAGATAYFSQVRRAYSEGRPYMHALIGAGALEADIREAIEGVAELLERFDKEQVPLSEALSSLEQALPSLSSPSALAASVSPKTIVPVGRAGQQLARLAAGRLSSTQWRCDSVKGFEMLCLLDLTDAACVTWLQEKARSQAENNMPSIHCVGLLPGLTAHRAAWDAAAAALAELTSSGDGNSVELGLAILAPLADGSAGASDEEDLLALLDALGSSAVRLCDLAFQLRPRPRSGFCVPARGPPCLSSPGGADLRTLTGASLGAGEVLAVYSFWPIVPSDSGVDRGSQGDEKEVSATGLLDPSYLKPGLLPEVARAGRPYKPGTCASAQGAPSWHLLAHEGAEAAMYRRAAGDFEGRSSAAFHWRESASGPRARLWDLAEGLDGVGRQADASASCARDEHGRDGDNSSYSDENYEDDAAASKLSSSDSQAP